MSFQVRYYLPGQDPINTGTITKIEMHGGGGAGGSGQYGGGGGGGGAGKCASGAGSLDGGFGATIGAGGWSSDSGGGPVDGGDSSFTGGDFYVAGGGFSGQDDPMNVGALGGAGGHCSDSMSGQADGSPGNDTFFNNGNGGSSYDGDTDDIVGLGGTAAQLLDDPGNEIPATDGVYGGGGGGGGGNSFEYFAGRGGDGVIAIYLFFATTYTRSGPASGTVLVNSTNFTITPDDFYTGSITPNDNGAGGTFTPSSLTWAAENTVKTFKYKPLTTGVKVISFTNDHGITDPADINYTSIAAVSVGSKMSRWFFRLFG